VRPDLNLVVVITANGNDNVNRYGEFMKSFLEENIYSAVQSDAPLPANPQAARELDSTLLAIEHPGASPVRPMPAMAAAVSHGRYILEPNTKRFKSTSLSFDSIATCSWTYRWGDRTITMQVGLRGNYVMNRTDFSMGVNPDGEEVACKGHWKKDDTFVIEHHIMGDPSKQLFELRFFGDSLALHITTIGLETIIKGKIDK